tara:strand:- start:300 stop:1172 length:873 start_codon:yes stop_codon:yes gene_type:complete
MKAFLYFIVLIIIFFIGACSTIEEPKLISVDDIELVNDSDEEFILNTNLSIYNPNWFSLSAKDAVFNIYIDTAYLGTAMITDGIFFPKKDTSEVVSVLKINKNNLYSGINLNDSILLNVIGSIKAPKVYRDFYFEFDYKLDISDYLSPIAVQMINESDLQIKEVKIKSIDLMRIQLEVLFDIDNKTNTKYEITKLDINIFNSPSFSTLLGKSSINNSFTVLPDTLNIFSTNVSVNTLSMGTAILSNTVNSSNSFYLKVNSIVKFNEIEIPIVIKKRVDYNPLTLEIKLHE